MTREELYEELNKVFWDIFDNDQIALDDATTAADIEGWDSLEHINLIVAVEKRFHIRFNMGEANNMKNVGDMVDIILSKILA